MALSVKLTKSGAIVIRLPKGDLARATRANTELWDSDDDTGRELGPKVVDVGQLAKDVFHVLDVNGGAELVQDMFDKAIVEAVESGCNGVMLPSDYGYGRKVFMTD